MTHVPDLATLCDAAGRIIPVSTSTTVLVRTILVTTAARKNGLLTTVRTVLTSLVRNCRIIAVKRVSIVLVIRVAVPMRERRAKWSKFLFCGAIYPGRGESATER